jgi:cyclohexanecarboxylate-CoA ligase
LALKPTYRHPEAAAYRAPGGPWDLPSLDAVVTTTARAARGELLIDDSAGVRIGGPELLSLVAAVAGGLRAQGVRRGDVVAWQAPNWWEGVVLFRACWRLGAVAAPVHHLAGPADVDRMLEMLRPKLFLAPTEVRGRTSRFTELSERAQPVHASAGRPSDVAVVLFTSGSTGGPKAALHTQRGLAYKARVMARAHALEPSDAVLMPAPLAHISGLLNAVLLPGAVPMRAQVMPRWDADEAVELIEREQVTFMIGPPTFFVGLMSASSFAPSRVASLRLVSSGGAGVTPSFVVEASERLGAVVKRTYGSTEAPTITTSMANDPIERARDTDGRVTGAARLRVSDPETGVVVPTGETGELWLRGPELFVGYSDAEATRASTARGWFRTGDLATVDPDGWLTIVGRIKDIIIRGGENIAAAELETTLEAHPDVLHAVAVGYPDERLGERVCAFVVAAPSFDLEACRHWFEHEGIARYKTPERVVHVDELPVLGPGKPDRAALRARAQEATDG